MRSFIAACAVLCLIIPVRAEVGEPDGTRGIQRHATGHFKSLRKQRVKISHKRIGRRGVSLAGVVPELVAKANEIVMACGSIVISARSSRPNRSNHPIGRAVDLQGNPSCIYARLKGWRGGYSTDYHTAPGGKHVHISWNPGGQEWGVRFVHRNPFLYARRARSRI